MDLGIVEDSSSSDVEIVAQRPKAAVAAAGRKRRKVEADPPVFKKKGPKMFWFLPDGGRAE